MCGLYCSSNGVFNAELSALFTALRHIAEPKQPPERCLILTDSMSSIKAMLSRKIAHQTHPLVCMNVSNCAGAYARTELRLELMWIPSHVGLVGNELVDERSR
jgi:ribonuclease HI